MKTRMERWKKKRDEILKEIEEEKKRIDDLLFELKLQEVNRQIDEVIEKIRVDYGEN